MSETLVTDLAAWLTQIWDEDERTARNALQGSNEAREQPLGGPLRLQRWHTERVGQRVLRVQSGGPATRPTKIVDVDPLVDREIADHIVLHDPAAVLARIAADQQILALHQPDKYSEGRCPVCLDYAGYDAGGQEAAIMLPTPCPTVRLLASAHADRPGYQEAWKP